MSNTLNPDPHLRSLSFLDNYASERWESVLQFLVQPQDGPKAISRDAIRTLLHAKLIERLVFSYYEWRCARAEKNIGDTLIFINA